MLDVVKIRVKGGKGGDGRVSFLHLKYQPKGGPDGGDGGNGGEVVLVLNDNYPELSHLSQKFLYQAENGQGGGKNKKSGASGKSVFIPIPKDTYVWQVAADFNLKGNVSWHLREEGKLLGVIGERQTKLVVAHGGKGGKGNWHFRTATNQAPQFAQAGTMGEDKTLVLELKLLADIGLIGLPNAGKSSLLRALTQARPKVADYPFTTLNPHLGILNQRWRVGKKKIVLIDVPGLIGGAAQGKGLGYQFLRHIQRAKLLVHLVEPVIKKGKLDWLVMKKNYQVTRTELENYGFGLAKKPELVYISKADLVEPELRKLREPFQGYLSIEEPQLLQDFVHQLQLVSSDKA